MVLIKLFLRRGNVIMLICINTLLRIAEIEFKILQLFQNIVINLNKNNFVSELLKFTGIRLYPTIIPSFILTSLY